MAPPGEEPPQRSGGPRTIRWLVFGVVLAGVLFYLGWEELPREVARWYLASAIEAKFAGRYEQAILHVDKGLEWDPENFALYQNRAECEMELKHYDQALADVNQAIELADESEEERAALYMLRSQVHQYLKQPKKALEDLDAVAEITGDQSLNNRAYVRAVGDIELDQGLREAESEITDLGGDLHNLYRGGIFLYRAKRPEAAAELFDRAVGGMKGRYAEMSRQQKVADAAKPFLGDLLDEGPFDRRAEVTREDLARSYGFRSLARKAAGDEADGKADLQQAEQLGADAQSLEDRLKTYDVGQSFNSLYLYATVVDTRGFLHYQRGDYETALRDFDASVELAEALDAYWRSLPEVKSMQAMYSPAEWQYRMRQRDKNLAVIHYHRGLAYEALGQTQQAEQDYRRVRDLGFEPGPDLF